MNLALAIKNAINKFRNNGNDNLVENQSGIIIPIWLQNRKITDTDSACLIEFFKTFGISFFSEVTADLINEYGNKSYEKVIKVCNLLGLYGVKFLGRSTIKYSPNSSNRDLIIRSNDSQESIYNLKFTNSHIDFVINKENETKIFNFLKNENITTIKQLNGIHLGVMSDKIGVSLELLVNLIENSGLQVFENPSRYQLYTFDSEKLDNNTNDFKNHVEFLHLFSTRTENVLRANDINSIEQLINLTEEQILGFKNAGSKTVSEILNMRNCQNLLSTRTKNILQFNNIDNIDQLKQLSEQEILNIKNAGSKTVREIFDLLNALKLKELYEEEKRLKLANKYYVPDRSHIEVNGLDEVHEINISNCLIREINFSTRTYNILKANNVNNLYDLLNLNDEQILSFKNSGQVTLNNIKSCLNELNLSLNSKNISSRIVQAKQEEIIINIETYNKPFKEMLIESRVINSLERVGINKLGDILDLTEAELFRIDGLGESSIIELKKTLQKYDIDLQNKYILGDNSLDEKYFYNLFEANLSNETQNILKKFGIKNVGQLIEIFPDKFYEDDDYCSNPDFIKIEDEIKEYLRNIGIDKYPVTFSKTQRDKLNELSINEILNLNLSTFLVQKLNEFENEYICALPEAQKVIYFERIKPDSKYIKTLEEIGTKFDVSRERIRQIEKKSLLKQKIVFNEKFLLFNIIFNKLFNEFGNIIYLEDAKELSNFKGTIQQLINESDSFNFKVNTEDNLLVDKEIDIEDIYTSILENISSTEIEVMEKFNIENYVNEELLNYINNDNINQRNNFLKLINTITENLLEKHFIKLNENTYKTNFGTRKKSSLTDRIVYFYKTLYPEGEYIYLNFDKVISNLKQHLPELEKHSSRALQGRMLHSGDLILWKKGFYIHKDNINPDWQIVDETVNRIIELFDSGICDPKIDKLFYEREQEYINANIPDSRALYSVLRLKNNPSLILDEWPRIFDSNKGRDKRELLEVFSDYVKEKGEEVSKEEINSYFCSDRGWKSYELEQTFARATNVIKSDKGYIHIDNLKFNVQELEKIIEITKQKIETTGNTIHLRKIKEDYNVTWRSVCDQDISYDLMGILLCKKGKLPFKIDRKVYAKPLSIEETEETNEITFVELISDWILEQSKENKYVTNKEIYEYCNNQGFNSWNALNTVKKANIIEYYENSFVHPEVIGYSEEILQDLILIAEQAAKLTYEKSLPYIKFELILEQYKENLPSLNDGYEWTKELLASLLSKINFLEVFNGAFIFRENPFNIEDLDDVAAFLIAKNFVNGICKLKELEKLLAQEEIIKYKTINSYKQELFAEGSSIELVDDGNNVVLSKIGRERYLNV